MFQGRNIKILLNMAKRRNRDSRNISNPCFFFSKRTAGMLKNNDQLSLTIDSISNARAPTTVWAKGRNQACEDEDS